jgi:F-type H+-transporting ATPase subunit a
VTVTRDEVAARRKSAAFRLLDILYLLLLFLPLATVITLKVLFTPAREGIVITGALVYFEIPMPVMNFVITEAQINSAAVILSLLGLCLFLTHGMHARFPTRRQILAEWLVEKAEGLVKGNMKGYFSNFAPFVAAILALSCFSSLLSLLGLFPPTSDINVTAGWAILVFALITFYKMKAGPIEYCKSFGVIAPLNIVSEVATPISMAFRHYGNVLSGTVISVLIGALLQSLSGMIFGALPGFLGEFPFLQVGLPAVLSLYFDLFSGGLQAYIFAMLTMLYVSDGFPEDEYFRRLEKRRQKRAAKAEKKS